MEDNGDDEEGFRENRALIPRVMNLGLVPVHVDLRTCIEAGLTESYLVKMCTHYNITLGELNDLVAIKNSRRSSIPFLVKLRHELLMRGGVGHNTSITQFIDDILAIREEVRTSADGISIRKMMACFWQFDEMPVDAKQLLYRIVQIQDVMKLEYTDSCVVFFLHRATELQERFGYVSFEDVLELLQKENQLSEYRLPDLKAACRMKDYDEI